MRAFLLLISLIISSWSFVIKAQTTTCFSATYVANPTCPGLKTGNISLNITGGSGSYNIFFSGSTIATTQTTFSNLSAGAYAIRIIDAKNINCTQTISAIINNYLVPTVTINGNSSFCSGQNISLTATLDKFYSTSYSYAWSNGNKGSTINIVPTSAGSYSVSVTDAAGCNVTSSKSITQVSGPSVSFSGSYTNCSGKAVTLVPIISGGTAPYTYSWDGVISSTATKTVNPTSPQTYCLTVRDANNCSAQACVVVNQRSLNVNLPTGISKCQGESYTIVPTVSNFSGALSYQWSNGSTSSTNPVTINATQSYAVTVSDATGCIGTASTSIGMNTNPSVNLPTSLDVCQFNAVTLDTKLSTLSNTFTWSTGSSTSSITLTPSSSTNISVTVTNANNCKSVAAVSINVKSNPSISLPTSQITCANTSFTLTPAISGGTPGYAYLWSNGSTNTTLTTSLSVSGAISLRVTDQNGCAANLTTSITVRNSPTVSISGTTLICPGQTISLNTNTTGGTSPYTYQWNTNSNNQNISVSPTSVTTYTVTVTDNLGCSNSSSISISPTKSLNVNLPTGISKCQGESYTIVPTVSNFSGALSYQWSNGATSSTNPVIINATQSYAVTVSDATGCIDTASTSIGMNANPTINLPATIDVCQFNAVTLDTKLSTTSNTFAWSTGSTASAITLTPTSSTNISVIVINANNCKAAAAVSINVKSNPSVSLPTSQITCANTSFTLTPAVSGGTPGYVYLWSNGSINATLTTSLSVSGAISLRVTDQNGCIATAISGITLIPNPTIAISGIFEICPGQSTTLIALPSGGTLPYSYKWNTGDTGKLITTMPLIPTTYKITLIDKNNCIGEGSILVSTTKNISVTIPFDVNICPGDSITLKPIIGTNGGDLNYLWNNGTSAESLLVMPLSKSKFSLLVKDKLGCSGYAETTVNVNTPPKATLPAIINGCLADSVKINLRDISGAGPFNFKWSNGKTTTESTYFVDSDKIIFTTITDVNQCKNIISSKIIGNEKPVLELNAKHTFCLNESVRINPKVTGGLAPYSYIWSNGITSVEFNAPLIENTNLTLVVSDKMGCTDKKSTFIELKKEIPQIFLPDTIRRCMGDEVLINPIIQDKVGVSSYQWSDGETKSQIIKKVLNSFTMKLQVMNLIGCMAIDSLLILPFNKPNIVLPSIFEACKSDKVIIEIPSDPDNRTTYQWGTGERSNKIEVFANESKLLKVWATNYEGCKDSATSQLKIFENPIVNLIGKKENCSNTPSSFSVDILSGNSPYQIKWASGETTSRVDYPTVDSIQKVGVEITDVKGCRAFSSLPLTLLKSPDIQILSEFFICENDEKTLNPMVTLGKKPYIYKWNTNQSSPGIIVKNGVYTFSVTDANGCSNRKDIKVTPIKPPELYVTSLNQPSCNLPNGKIVLQIKSTSPTEVTWSNGKKGLMLDNAYAGKYIAAAIDSNNCFGELSQNLVCNCEGKVGVMDGNMVSICKNEVRQSKYDASNQKLGLNNGRWFILHNSPGINLGNQILNMDTTGIIKYYQGMIVGETYYLSAVIGRKLSDGSLDLNDPCLSISPGTPVKILATPETPIKIEVSDTLVCPGSSIILQTNKQDNGFIYIWQTPKGFINTLTPSLTIPKFEKQDIGNYYLRINSEKCTSNAFGPIPINFSKEIGEIFTEPDKSVCGKDSVFISANMPLNANGKWLTGSSAIIGDPQNENTWVKGLIPGENEFLWTVVTRNCIITDTLKIYYVPRPKLKNDTVYLDDNKNTALFDFLENDELSNIPPSFLRINLISKPLSGNLFINKEGYFTYSRDPNISEDQSLAFVYEVCNTDTTGNCTNNCNLAEVILNVTFNPRTLIYPTIGLRPNFNNPVWKFEAARPMYSAKLNILDRWGKVVFKEEFLQLQKGEIVGNWNGLSQNQLKLPAGAYYFSLIGEIENNEKVVQNGIIYLME
jgi:hypothetical protein